jgi:iron(III) transport system substrate-binding protein
MTSLALVGLVASGCGGATTSAPAATAAPAAAKTGAAASGGEMAALVDAAKKEGTVVWLEAAPQAFAQQAADAFQAQYGIKVEFLALNSGPLQQRFLTEAQAGSIATDVIMLSNPEALAETSLKNKWIQPIKDANLPALSAGYPTKYVDNTSAVVIFSPYNIWYNKSKVSGALVPKSLEDLTDPKYKGMINLTNPSTSDSLVQFYDVIQQKYGDGWFEKIAANQPKFYPSASAAVQAIAGGEGAIATPAITSVGAPLIASGAPLAEVSPPITTGSELRVLLTASDKAPHPNAAKLFANWLLSKEGSLAATKGDLAISPWEPDKLPSGWVSGRTITPEIKTKIMTLLGVT